MAQDPLGSPQMVSCREGSSFVSYLGLPVYQSSNKETEFNPTSFILHKPPVTHAIKIHVEFAQD
jgi:hypothetical protein